MNSSGRFKNLIVAAVASAIAAVFVVAVGPGFSAPNENASETAVEATSDTTTETTETVAATDTSTEVATTEASTADATTTSTQQPHDPVNGNPNASNTPDSHGHVGSGTGTSTGSQADPGHKDDGGDRTRGNAPAPSCTNKHNDGPETSGNGANTSGPYNSTCDGDPSENGNGGGNATGRPCAGCVGNADNKNPPGQVKEHQGKKANDMGYECDGNQGVGAHYGRGNPAHTADCQQPPPCPTDLDPDTEGLQCTPPCVDQQPDVPGRQCEPGTCPTDMNPFVDGLQCEPPPCPTDMQPNVPGLQCEPPPCPDMQPNVPGRQCEPGTCPTDMNPNVPGLQCEPPVCVDNMLTPEDECNPPEPCPDMQPDVPGRQCEPLTCPQDMNPFVAGLQCEPPEVCPAGTDRAGQIPPGGNMSKCDIPPGGGEEPLVVCPAGTDMAGEPMPAIGVEGCDDDVLGDIITNPGDKGDDVAPGRLADKRPGVLPFTGTSILAYVVIALQLIGAGALIARGRKAK